jgi:hypothetical protein
VRFHSHDRYEELREEIPILDVLLDIGASVPGWASGGWGDWKKVVCPFCTDTNGSASYNAGAGRFLCHQCGAPRDGSSGDVVDVARLFLGTNDDEEAIQWLNRRFRR